MKLLVAALIALSFAASGKAHAQSLFVIDSACACDPAAPKDPLEEPVRFAFGKFQGQCVDSCRFRRARVLESRAEMLEVGNVLHLGKYRRARLPLDQIEGAEVGFERFATGVDHVLLRFTFREDVPLFAQDDRAMGKPVAHTRSLVISSEGVPPKGHPYSLSEGYYGYYLLDHRLVTGDELATWLKKLGHPLRLMPLRLSGTQAARVLEHGIRRSEAESFRTAYQLFANNCSTSALSLLDAETGFRNQSWDPLHWFEFEEALPIAGPVGTARALRYRGLLSGGAEPSASHAETHF